MLISNSQSRKQYLQSGVWGTRPLDAILYHNALNYPEIIALQGNTILSHHSPVSYATLNSRVNRLAHYFRSLALFPDMVIAIRMENSIEHILCLLAIWRAGLIACPIPMTWSQSDMAVHLGAVGAKILLGSTHFANKTTNETLIKAASDIPGIRYILGVGQASEGINDISSLIWQSDQYPDTPPLLSRYDEANHVATLTCSMGENTLFALPRSHNHWVALAMMGLMKTSAKRHARIFSPFAPTHISGLGTGLASWLLSSGTLYIDQYTDSPSCIKNITTFNPDKLLLPASITHTIMQDLPDFCGDILAIRHPHLSFTPLASNQSFNHYDCCLWGDFAIHITPAGENNPNADFPIGDIFCAHDTQKIFATSKVDEKSGELWLKGAIIPEASWPNSQQKNSVSQPQWDDEGFIATGLLTTTTSKTNHEPTHVTINGFGENIITTGGLPVRLDTVDALYQSCPLVKDAIAVALKDNILGLRLYGVVIPHSPTKFSQNKFYAYLENSLLSKHLLPKDILIMNAPLSGKKLAENRQQLTQLVQQQKIDTHLFSSYSASA